MTPEEKIRAICKIVEFPEDLAVAIAKVESAMGKYILSPTGAKGIFQLTSIAMKDMLQVMAEHKYERTAILCGIGFLCLLQDRWMDAQEIVFHFCDPAEKDAYWKKIQKVIGQDED